MSALQQHATDADHTESDHDSAAALRHLAWVIATLNVCGLMTYATPQLANLRPWVQGEPIPLVDLFGRTASTSNTEPNVAGATGSPGGQPTDAQLPAVAAAELARKHADASVGAHVDASEFEGVTQSIDQPEQLSAFYAALAATANKKAHALTRIAHYGDSAVAADGVTSAARRLFQARFGDAGHGFMLTARGDMHYNHRDIRARSGGEWELMHIVRAPLRNGWYGYGGVQYRGHAGASATFETPDDSVVGRTASRFEVFFQKGRGGGDIRVSADGDVLGTIDTRAATLEDGWQTFDVPDGEHSFSLRVGGRGLVTMYGVALERDLPGVVYDSLGLVGARAQRLLNADPVHFRRQIEHRAPQLLVLAFGGNESGDKYLNLDTYKQELRTILHNLRGSDRSMSCLLFAPLDQGEKNERGVVETVEILPSIIAAQAEVARSEGCAFYNAWQAMGGEGSMARWYKHRPRWATSDFRHATPEGYDVMGEMFYKALLKGFAEYLTRNPR
jgi:lysophospholipase L1-like esterase